MFSTFPAAHPVPALRRDSRPCREGRLELEWSPPGTVGDDPRRIGGIVLNDTGGPLLANPWMHQANGSHILTVTHGSTRML